MRPLCCSQRECHPVASDFCLECSGVHRSLGVHISFVRSLNMDSWNGKQQARMRSGGNTALRTYLRQCGMPEEYNRLGQPIIRDKYHTKAATAYREHIAALERGEASSLQPVPWEVIVVQAATEKKMAGFGSGPPPPPDGGMAGLDSLMSSLGSLGSATASITAAAKLKAQAAAASAKELATESALPALGTAVGAVKGAVSAARGRAETLATFDATKDLAHLRSGADDDGDAPAASDSATEGFGGFSGFDLAGNLAGSDGSSARGALRSGLATVGSTASWLWSTTAETVVQASSFDAGSDLAHLRPPANQGGSDAGSSGRGGFGGFGSSEATQGQAGLPVPPPPALSAAGASDGWTGEANDGWGWGEDDDAIAVPTSTVTAVPAPMPAQATTAAPPANAAPSAAKPKLAASKASPSGPSSDGWDDDGWGDGWDDDK